MHAKLKTLVLTTLVGAGLFGLTATAEAQSYYHVHGLVSKLEKQMNVLHNEVDAHFKPFPQYVHLHQDVVKMQQLTKHIHQLIDQKANLHHILADVNALDKSYHHVRGLVKHMTLSGQLDLKSIIHFNQALNMVGNTLHHLREDLEEIDHHYHHDFHYHW